MTTTAPPVAIIMGSRSDWPTLKGAAEMLDALGVAHEAKVISAHRTPQRLHDFAGGAQAQGFKVIIAGAGGAAHLPGMLASVTPLPVVGVQHRAQVKRHGEVLVFDHGPGDGAGQALQGGGRFDQGVGGFRVGLQPLSAAGAQLKAVRAGKRHSVQRHASPQIVESAPADQGDRALSAQAPEQGHHPGQGRGLGGVGHDGREGAVEVEEEGRMRPQQAEQRVQVVVHIGEGVRATHTAPSQERERRAAQLMMPAIE